MALSMLQRKPDSGLGNIRSSPADPSRNIDWVLMTAQAALTIAGCFVVFSATRTRTADPYTYVTRQVIFAIVATAAMAVVMAIDYQWLKGACPHALPADGRRAVRAGRLRHRRAGNRAGHRHRPDPDPARRVRQVHRSAGVVRLPERRARRRGQLSTVPRRPDDRRIAGDPHHHPARPRHGVGAHRDGDGCAPRRRGQGPLHRRHQPALAHHARSRLRRPSREPVPAGAGARVLRREQPRAAGRGVPGDQRRAGGRHGRPVRQGLAAGPADQRA